MELSNIKGKSWLSTKFTYPQTKSHYEKVMVLQRKKKKKELCNNFNKTHKFYTKHYLIVC